MSKDKDDVAKSVDETKKRSEDDRSALNTFLESLRQSTQYSSTLLLLIEEIGGNIKGSQHFDAFLRRPVDYEKLGDLLAKALDKKAISEEQVLSFFEKLSKTMKGHGIIISDQLLRRIEDRDDPTNFLPKVIQVLFNNLLALLKTDPEQEESVLLMGRDILREFSTAAIFKAYTLHKDQKTLLTFILRIELARKHVNPRLIGKLKMANLEIFEQVYEILPKELQDRIDKSLLIPDSDRLMKLIKTQDFKTAAEVFHCYSDAPRALLLGLEDDSVGISDKQIMEFFKVVLMSNSNKNIQTGFLALRACLESPLCVKIYPTLSTTLVSQYLNVAAKSKKLTEALSLLSTKPSWKEFIANAFHAVTEEEKKLMIEASIKIFESTKQAGMVRLLYTLNPDLFSLSLSHLNDASLKKHIQDLLLTPLNETTSFAHPEWTIQDETLIASFKEVLNDPDLKKSEYFVKVIERIGSLLYHRGSDVHHLGRMHLSLYLEKGIELKKVKELCETLASQPLMIPYVLEAYASLSKSQQALLLEGLLEAGGNTYNAALVGGLQDLNPRAFNQGVNNVAQQNKDLADRIKRLALIPHAERLMVADMMEPFTLPFRGMNHYAAKLFCASTKHKKSKSYSFNPTVLYGEELKEYLEKLKSAKRPVREKFILDTPVTFATAEARHWIAGEIEIPKEGNPRMLIIDSLGSGEPKTLSLIKEQCSNVFPKLDVYLSSEKRQKSGLGCTLFALKDTQDLYTGGQYLGPTYGEELFNYALKSASLPSSPHSSLQIRSFELPPRMMRLQQDPQGLIDTLQTRTPEEQALKVNKKGETALASAEKHFKKYTGRQGFEKKRNERLVYKLSKMASSIFDYISSQKFNLQRIEEAMDHFSLETLDKRLSSSSEKTVLSTSTPEVALDSAYEVKTRGDQQERHDRVQSALHFQFSETKPTPRAVPKEFPSELKDSVEIAKTSSTTPAHEHARTNLINIFQVKFHFRVIRSVNWLINELFELHENKKITDVDSLKATLKMKVPDFSTRFLSGIEDAEYKAILENLSMMGPALPNKKRPIK